MGASRVRLIRQLARKCVVSVRAMMTAGWGIAALVDGGRNLVGDCSAAWVVFLVQALGLAIIGGVRHIARQSSGSGGNGKE